MKLNQDFMSSYLSTKSLIFSPDKEEDCTVLISDPKQKPSILPPPRLYQPEKSNRQRNCVSPPPSFLFQSDPQSNHNSKLSQRKNPEKLKYLELSKIKCGKSNPNKSLQVRDPPSFLRSSKNNLATGTSAKVSKKFDRTNSNEKLQTKDEDSWRRKSANPTFFQKLINNCKSEDSSQQERSVKESPRKPFINSAASVNGHSQTSKPENNKMALPPRPSNKTKSQRNFNMNEKSNSKVPAFIRNKEYAKSQNPSSSNSEKGVSLFQMMNSVEVASEDRNSEQDAFSIKINIKPAQKKRSVDDFYILKELGSGSYGKACLAVEKQLGFVCVLKIIQKEKMTEFEVTNLLREVKIQTFLSHEHLTSLYGCFKDDEYIYLVMELLPTGNLIERTRKKTFPEKEISKIVVQVCLGISYMHNNNVLHRDLKPENIFTFDNNIKLGDFGCAVYSDITRNSFVGSPCYLSPQQLKNEFYDQKVDMWEIGTLTYELLFKKCPYEKDILEMMQGQRKLENLSELRFSSAIPASEEAKDFIRRALEKNPSKRLSLDEGLSHPFLNQSYKEMTNHKLIR